MAEGQLATTVWRTGNFWAQGALGGSLRPDTSCWASTWPLSCLVKMTGMMTMIKIAKNIVSIIDDSYVIFHLFFL